MRARPARGPSRTSEESSAHSYASIDPLNTGSRRVFEKLGFLVDTSRAARAFADEPRDVVMSIDRKTFERINGNVFAEFTLRTR